ncbi:hypothetical protein TNCV_4707211 [Trichonephila clavipes]|nr:hypothetical protein TNCV_4707211 [Trichonephila clavipes]
MVLKANDRRTSCPCHDEFRGHRSDYVRQDLLQNHGHWVKEKGCGLRKLVIQIKETEAKVNSTYLTDITEIKL